jgi:hypothetical protein
MPRGVSSTKGDPVFGEEKGLEPAKKDRVPPSCLGSPSMVRTLSQIGERNAYDPICAENGL